MKGYALTCCLLIGALFLSCGKGAEPRNIPFATLAKGTSGGPSEPSDMIVRDAAVLESLWVTISPEPEKAAPLPAVDFGVDMVIAVFAGQKPSSGYAIEVKSIQDVGESIHVQVVDTKPPPEVATMTVITHPYHVVKLPKLDKPVKFFHSEVTGKIGGSQGTE